MTMQGIAAALGGLTLQGMNNLTLGETPQAVATRLCPVLTRSTHEPDFITDYLDTQITVGGNARHDYTLNYKYFYAPVGKERGLFAGEVDNVTKLQALVNQLLANRQLGGARYIALATLPTFRTVVDASAQEFHGAVIALRITEF